jgi:multidrug resistance efflux pump
MAPALRNPLTIFVYLASAFFCCGVFRVMARQLQEQLAERLGAAVQPSPEPSASPDPVTFPPRPRNRVGDAAPSSQAVPASSNPAASRWSGRLGKTALALAIAATLGYIPMRYFFEPASTEAIVNARVVTVRAPIEGVYTFTGSIQPGERIAQGGLIGEVANKRADRTRLDELSRAAAAARDDIALLQRRIAGLDQQVAGLRRQTTEFREARGRQLQARLAEIDHEAEALDAAVIAANAAVSRSERLIHMGAESQAGVETARRDARAAIARRQALDSRRSAILVEQDALATGIFVGDSYNDRPASAHRLDDAEERLESLRSERRERELRLERLERDLALEQERFAAIAAAPLPAPIGGRIWEVLTASGEEVARGQELARILDCGTVAMTAAVAEHVYNRLSIGDPAEIRLLDSNLRFTGRVASLTGVAAAQSNFAIAVTELERARFRVTVAVPDLARESNCAVGRTGRIVFGQPAKGG